MGKLRKKVNSPSENSEMMRQKAEIEKLEAETEKLKLETAELKEKFNSPWYKYRHLLNPVVFGLLALPTVWFYLENVFLPTYQIEQIRLQNQYNALNDSLNAKLVLLQRGYTKLDSSYLALKNDYEYLSKLNNLTQQQRDELKQKLTRLEADLDLVNASRAIEKSRSFLKYLEKNPK